MNVDDLRRLEAVGVELEFPAGHVLIERGQPGSGVYVILDGMVVVEAPEGNLPFGAGSLVGERALLSEQGRRAARVRATTDLRVIAVDRQEFEQLCADDPAFAQRLVDAKQT
jgi:CRP-like cAMP-binding protein